jgi:hypothetical protein
LEQLVVRGAMVYVPADGQTYVVVKIVLVTTPELVETVAYGQVTVVACVTTVVTPPAVWLPAGILVEVAPHTVVDSVRVMVVAGMVYTPVVGHVVAKGVGATPGGV